MEPFKIAYVGGGSGFVVTLLHGIASQTESLTALGTPIELALVDPDRERAGEMARYAGIVARQTGLTIRAAAVEDRLSALEGAGLVIFSPGMWEEVMPARKRFLDPRGLEPDESGPALAVEAAALWPCLRGLGEDMRRLCPQATFATLVNPTDLIAAAFERAFGVRSVGLCVEVPGLVGWLSYYLEVPDKEIDVRHIGVNHVGWVSCWTVGGEDGQPLFDERIPRRMERDDWYPHATWFARLRLATGFLRASPYHHWPFRVDWDEGLQRRSAAWLRSCLPGWRRKRDYRRARLREALAEGRMIEDADGTRVHPEAAPYAYPDTRRTLGALVAGLMGGSTGPVPLQILNGRSNPGFPEEARLEIPTCIDRGRLLPQTVPRLPASLHAGTATLAVSRACLAGWLAEGDRRRLAEGLIATPWTGDLSRILGLAEQLAEFPFR